MKQWTLFLGGAMSAVLLVGLIALLWNARQDKPRTVAQPLEAAVGATEREGPDPELDATEGAASRTSATETAREHESAQVQRDGAVLRPAPSDRSRLTGRVLKEDGGALEGAEVEVWLATTPLSSGDPVSPGASFRERASTDAEGRFDVGVPSRRALVVRARDERWAPAWRSPVFGGQDLELTLLAPGRLGVYVTGPDGEPFAGASVRAWSLDASGTTTWQRESETGADGEPDGTVHFEGVPRAQLSVRARAPGLVVALRRANLEVQDEAWVELELERGLSVRGRVVAAATGEPLVGARVGCASLGFALTDDAGRYELSAIAPTASSWGIGALLEGYEPTYRYVRINVSTGDVELDFELAPAPTLRGQVVDASGAGVAGAEVLARGLQPTAPFVGEVARHDLFTDPEGRFAIDPVHPTSRWTIHLRGPAGGRARLEAGPFPAGGGDVDLGRIVLGAAASITGRVEPSPAIELDDARVGLRLLLDGGDAGRQHLAAAALPDPWGGFQFEELAPGRYLVELHRAEKLGTRAPLAVREVLIESGVVEHVILAPGAGLVRGQVVDPSGQAVTNASFSLTLLDEKARIVAHGRVEPDGTFGFGLPESGEYALVVSDSSLRYMPERIEGVCAGVPELRVAVRQRTDGRRIRGYLRRADGTPVNNVYVALRDAATLQGLGRVAPPDARGEFVMEGLERGPYLVEVADFAGRYEPKRPMLVETDGDPIEIVLVPRP